MKKIFIILILSISLLIPQNVLGAVVLDRTVFDDMTGLSYTPAQISTMFTHMEGFQGSYNYVYYAILTASGTKFPQIILSNKELVLFQTQTGFQFKAKDDSLISYRRTSGSNASELNDTNLVFPSGWVLEMITAEEDTTINENQITNFGISGGLLEMGSNPLSLSGTTFDNDTVQTSTGTNTIVIENNQADGVGWNVKVSSTKFVSVAIPDPSGGNGNITVSIPTNALTIQPQTITTLFGQPIHATYGPLSSNLTLSNSPQNLITAQSGFGMGKYSIPLNYTLTIPKTVTVDAITGIGSKYSVGNTIGILEGTYSATLTYTIGSDL